VNRFLHRIPEGHLPHVKNILMLSGTAVLGVVSSLQGLDRVANSMAWTIIVMSMVGAFE
jgi:hypothetical protein